MTKVDLQKQIWIYSNGQLTDEQSINLWEELIKSDKWTNYLQMAILLRHYYNNKV